MLNKSHRGWAQTLLLTFRALSGKKLSYGSKTKDRIARGILPIVRGNNRQDIFHDDEATKNYLKGFSCYLSEKGSELFSLWF